MQENTGRIMETYRKQCVRIGWSNDLVAGRGENDIAGELDTSTIDEACRAGVERAARIEGAIIAWQIKIAWLNTTPNRKIEGLKVTRKR
jgi:hypothetical protein